MTRSEILSMTKINLQIAGSSFDDYLEFLIDAAQNAIKAEGITIDFDAIDDCNLIVMYTSYLYRKRVGDDPVPQEGGGYCGNAAHAAVCAQQQGIRRKGEGGRGR